MTLFHSRIKVAVLQRLTRSQSGTAAIELAVSLSVFLVAVLGVMEFGRIMWAQNALNYAVQQTARCMLVNSCDTGTAPAYAATVSGYGFPSSVFTASTPACGHQVLASYSFSFMTNLFTYPVTLSAVSCM